MRLYAFGRDEHHTAYPFSPYEDTMRQWNCKCKKRGQVDALLHFAGGSKGCCGMPKGTDNRQMREKRYVVL